MDTKALHKKWKTSKIRPLQIFLDLFSFSFTFSFIDTSFPTQAHYEYVSSLKSGIDIFRSIS